MTDYQPLLARALKGLDRNTSEARRGVYDRARQALLNQLRSVNPPMADADITRERLALEDAIRKTETEAVLAEPHSVRAPGAVRTPVPPRISAPASPAAVPPPAPSMRTPAPPAAADSHAAATGECGAAECVPDRAAAAVAARPARRARKRVSARSRPSRRKSFAPRAATGRRLWSPTTNFRPRSSRRRYRRRCAVSNGRARRWRTSSSAAKFRGTIFAAIREATTGRSSRRFSAAAAASSRAAAASSRTAPARHAPSGRRFRSGREGSTRQAQPCEIRRCWSSGAADRGRRRARLYAARPYPRRRHAGRHRHGPAEIVRAHYAERGGAKPAQRTDQPRPRRRAARRSLRGESRRRAAVPEFRRNRGVENRGGDRRRPRARSRAADRG